MQFKIKMSDNQYNTKSISMIADIEGDFSDMIDGELPTILPILPVRNIVVFPGVVWPILLGRDSSLKLARQASKNNTLIGVVCQRDPDIEMPIMSDLYTYGVAAKIVKLFTLPSGSTTVIVQTLGRFRLKKITQFQPYLEGEIEHKPDIHPDKHDREWKTAFDDLQKVAEQYITMVDEVSDEALFAIRNIQNDEMMLNFLCSNMPFTIKEKIKLLEAESVKERLFGALKALNREINLQQLKTEIRNKTREDIDEQQKNYFLQQQIKNMQAEMGNEQSPEKTELLRKAQTKKWSEEIEKIFYKECDKLDNVQPQSPDYNVQLNYLQTFVSLPWNEYTKDDLNLQRAQKILDHDHYGMEKVKERILEHMAVLSLRGDLKSPIICLYGPPGVGKTSLGKSIAEAMKRKYVRVSLGGLHDEARFAVIVALISEPCLAVSSRASRRLVPAIPSLSSTRLTK